MRILNFGSLNIDRVYSVAHFVAGGETLRADHMDTFAGGKGLNQSVALARAGADVCHAGAIGADSLFLKELLDRSGANTDRIRISGDVSGHAIIQVTPDGHNSIITLAGANASFTEAEIDGFLDGFGAGDVLLMQNETNLVPYAMQKAHAQGLKIAFNASPINQDVFSYPLDLVDIFLINEIEGGLLADCDDGNYEEIMDRLTRKYPKAEIVLTLGGQGVMYGCGDIRKSHLACQVRAVDTTAAGDTFCGYYLASRAKGMAVDEALHMATVASAIAVTRHGAAPSIPTWQETEQMASGIRHQ